MVAIIGKRKFFLKIAKGTLLRYPVGRNFDEIALSRMVKEIVADLCFPFWAKIQKWQPFLGRGNFFENCQEYIAQIPCGLTISTKSLYLARLGR